MKLQSFPNSKSFYSQAGAYPNQRSTLHKLVVLFFSFYVALTPLDDFLGVPGTGRTILYFLGMSIVVLMGMEALARGYILRPRKAVWTLLAWLIFAFISTLWAQDPERGLEKCVTLAGLYFIYFFTSIYPWRPNDFRVLRRMTITVGVIASLAGIVLYYSGISYFNTGRASLFITPERRVDPNEFAVNLLLPSVFLMHSIFHTSGIKRIAAICVFGIIFLMIILTGSRGGIFQVIITLLWYLNLIRSRSRFSSVVGITLVLCGLLLLGIQILPPQVSGRLGIMSILQDQGTGRFTVWRMGLEALKDRPLFGYGWYNFPIAYDQYSAIFWPKNYRGRFLGWHRSAHNLYLQTLVELGIVGFGMLMCAIWSHFREIQGLVAKKDPLAPQISAILIAMLASGLTLEVATSKSFWATFGLVQIAVNISRTTRSNDAS